LATACLQAQTTPAAPAAASLAEIASGRVAPSYPVPYEPAEVAAMKATLDRVLGYLEGCTKPGYFDRDSKQPLAAGATLPAHAGLQRTDFILTSYEWGVTYSGMLQVASVTGDARYRAYVDERLQTIVTLAAHLKKMEDAASAQVAKSERHLALRNVLHPEALDDCGSMAAAMIKASRAGIHPETLRPWIDNYLAWVSKGQYRLPDGTLARMRPMPNTLWLDDLYMSVPALTQMGALTGDGSYIDDAARQIIQFSGRMFVRGKNLYRHAWVEAMEPHQAYHWARANGWAIVAMTELLDVMPENHPSRPAVLELYRSHMEGLAACQGIDGLWHQLLDRPETYPETSASAMYVYAAAHGINKGWLRGDAYGPMVSLGWNAVAQKVNAAGQVEGTCVGTGVGFDPAFYAYRPTSVFAAHGYGPVLLAGAEMIRMRENKGSGQWLKDGGAHFPATKP
jgi:rhamnogalacturonyl hydrolase YesR